MNYWHPPKQQQQHPETLINISIINFHEDNFLNMKIAFRKI